jgi:uncharacterized membrane protein YhaH (DUF805 family)
MPESNVLDTPIANPYESPQSTAEANYDGYVQAPPPSVMGTLFSFRGRVPRRVYWTVQLVVSAIYLLTLFGLLWTLGEESSVAWAVIAVLYVPFAWVLFASQVKRWHDRGKSAWWLLINFIPYVGGIWTLVECGCLRGTEGPNRFGPDQT